MASHSSAPFPLQTQNSTPVDTASRGVRPVPFSTPSYSAADSNPRLTISIGGEYMRVSRRRAGPPERREWRRGAVLSFSPRSRSRMLQSVAQIDQRTCTPDALFVTFTYPDEYPASTRVCKSHLDAFRKRLLRRHPNSWFYWKLEYQVRGAPHFHLILFNSGTEVSEWFHETWWQIVGSGDHYHWFYGADVRRVHTWREVGGYCAKYTAKADVPHVCDSPGRFWGIANRSQRPATLVEAELTDGEFYAIRRALRRYMGGRLRGYHAPGGPTSGVWARIHWQTAKKLANWAADEYHPVRGAWISPHDSDDAPGRRERGNGYYSTDGWDAGVRTMFARTEDTSNMRLFDSRDCQRAAALAACH